MLRGAGLRLLASTLLGALALFGLATCDDFPVAGACGQGGPVNPHVARPALIFACSAAAVDGVATYRLWRLLPHGAEQLSSEPAQDPAVAPSGSRLAFDGTAAGRPNVYIASLNGRSAHVVAAAAGGQSEPAWSPDGTRLAYVSGQRGLHGPVGVSDSLGSLYVSNAGGGAARPITPDDAFFGEPAWAPDGHLIAYATDRGGSWHVATVMPDGADPRTLTGAGDAQWPSWSPNSRSLAYQWSETPEGTSSIWLMSSSGGGAHRLTAGSRPSWSPNGKWIAFVRRTQSGSDLWMIPARGGKPIRLTDDAGLKGRPSWV